MILEILGVPLQKQSARFAKRGNFMMKYQPKEVTNWAAQAKLQIINQLPKEHKPLTGEISICSLRFIFPPLKSWNKKTKETFKTGFKVYKATRPDVDNLMKSIFDVCNGLVWVDDAQIVEIEHIEKIYGEVPRIQLEVN